MLWIEAIKRRKLKKIALARDIAACSLVDTDRRFREDYFLHSEVEDSHIHIHLNESWNFTERKVILKRTIKYFSYGYNIPWRITDLSAAAAAALWI
jgi:hypothetical protein